MEIYRREWWLIGLDNGIVIRKKDHSSKIELPSFVKDRWDFSETDQVEIAYWRKCWGIRDRILDVLGGENDTGHYNITQPQLLEIINKLKKFLHQDYWEDYAESIWEYDEFIENQVEILINLSWLSWFMIQEGNDIEVYFYDSY